MRARLSLPVCAALAVAALATTAGALFEEEAAGTGLDFRHFIGATGSYYVPEIFGSGVALLDYDNDGDLDVLFLQGTILDKTKSLRDSLFPAPRKNFPGNRLFRNELAPGGKLRFTDVTEQAGVAGRGDYGFGAATGDYDNDGNVDLFVTNYGQNLLYHNNGNGTFSDVTDAAGLGQDPSFSSSAAFLDYDRDGYLDLFVARYNSFTVAGNKRCANYAGGREYCGPGDYHPIAHKLYHNDRRGHFIDVTQKALAGSPFGNGLGVVCADFNGDGWIDIYVANDKTPNQLWINRHDGTFRDEALLAGCAYGADGQAKSGMGVTAGDINEDGLEDIYVGNLKEETNSLFVSQAPGVFDEGGVPYRLAAPGLPYTTFGTYFFDYDNDGRLDLFQANGEVRALDLLRGEPFPYHQINQLFHNEGRSFREVTAAAGPVFALSEVSRGAAFGDIDNDGDIDIVVANANGPARLLLNTAGKRNHWLELRLVGTTANRDALGARAALSRKGKRPIWRRAATDGSYLSANDPRVHFGLGSGEELRAAPIENVLVIWPDGPRETWDIAQPDSFLTLRQGTGKAAPAARP